MQCDLWAPRELIAVGHAQQRRGYVVTAELCWSRVIAGSSAIVRTTAPAARRAPGTRWRPRLRSTKNSGCDAEGNADHVFDLPWRDTEVARDLGKAVPRLESIDKVLDARSAVNDKQLPKRAVDLPRFRGVRLLLQ